MSKFSLSERFGGSKENSSDSAQKKEVDTRPTSEGCDVTRIDLIIIL